MYPRYIGHCLGLAGAFEGSRGAGFKPDCLRNDAPYFAQAAYHMAKFLAGLAPNPLPIVSPRLAMGHFQERGL
jgi:hypothetical protein